MRGAGLLAAPLLAATLLAVPSAAQQARPGAAPALPPFSCVGAEALEDDVFAVPFAAGSDRPGPAARAPLDAAAELLTREPDRLACVLGHARAEGGQAASVRLAARRARAVSAGLRERGVGAERLRGEARVAGFSAATGNPATRGASVVVLPPAPPRPEPAPG